MTCTCVSYHQLDIVMIVIILTDKSVAMGTVVKVAPVVATHWEEIGYCLGLEDEEMDTIEQEVSRSGDQRSAYRKLMKIWLRSSHGRKPKTWRTFVMVLRELDIDCTSVLEVLQGKSSL